MSAEVAGRRFKYENQPLQNKFWVVLPTNHLSQSPKKWEFCALGMTCLRSNLLNLKKKEKKRKKEIMGRCAFWRERILWYIGTVLVSLWWWCCLHIALPLYVFKCHTRQFLLFCSSLFIEVAFEILKFIILSHNMRHDFVYSFHGQGQVICLHDHL